jgi:hypothetical protein
LYAIVRENTYDPTKLAQGGEQFAEFQALHASQPGYRGTIIVDASNGRQLIVNLWATEEDAMAALPKVATAVQRLLGPLMAGPSQLIGTGPVVLTDLTQA